MNAAMLQIATNQPMELCTNSNKPMNADILQIVRNQTNAATLQAPKN